MEPPTPNSAPNAADNTQTGVTIHRVKGRHVNSYIIEENQQLLVIDVALNGEKYVLGYIHEVLQRDIQDVRAVICTHDDFDHSGGVVALAKECDALVGMPYAARATMKKFVNDPLGIVTRIVTSLIETFRPRMWAMYFNSERDASAESLPVKHSNSPSSMADLKDLRPDFQLKHNRPIPGFETWQVIHTPGHSWDSCCYYHANSGSLISGDMLLGSAKKNRLVTPSIFTNSFHLRKSLKRLKALNLKHVYPGHGSSFHGENLLAD